MKKKRTVIFICPSCHQPLIQQNSAYSCNACAKKYPIKKGVVCFLHKPDRFYEETYAGDMSKITFLNQVSLKSILYFYFYKDFYLNAIRKYIHPSDFILDVGCAGGIKYLAQKGDVVGVDLSLTALKKVIAFYEHAVQADASKLPFPDETFDSIVSSYLFEHITVAGKIPLLREWYRVLKPGGRIIFKFDCDNNNPLFRWLKKTPELYRQQIIEHDHHYGLLPASSNLNLIKEAGFSVIKYRALNKTPLQYLPVYDWIGPYAHKSAMVAFAHRMGALLDKSKLLWVPYNALINWFDSIVEKFFPLDYARILFVVGEKPANSAYRKKISRNPNAETSYISTNA